MGFERIIQVTLKPLAMTTTSSTMLKSITSPKVFLNNKNIFLIDGSNDVYGLSSYLNAYEANSYISTNCLEAFTKLEQINQIDLIVLDVNTTGVNAFEMIRTLKTRDAYKNVPVLAVSTKYDLKDREKYLSVGATDYVYKAEELDFLFLKINHILNNPAPWNEKEVTTVLELFIDNVNAEKSKATIQAVTTWLENNTTNKYELKIADVNEDKRWALRRKIVVTPTLLKIAPDQQRAIIDNLNNLDKVFKKIGL